MESGFLIETMRPEDWPQVRRVYLEGLATGQASFETAAPAWEKWDAGHHPLCRLVARNGDELPGWAALSQVSAREVYRGVGEVSIYVSSASRGRGLGRALMEAVVAVSERHGFWTLMSSVFPENEASVRLHLSCGFRVVGRRERIARHHGRWRDTVILERRSPTVGDD